MDAKVSGKKPKYCLNDDNEFVIENYNSSKPFANFFPGIAGKYGTPMWAFYTNRGQAISSFGIKDKEHAILEFYPANKAWQLTSSHGFRTFIKLENGKKTTLYEPFHNGPASKEFVLKNRMTINSHSLTIEEENLTLGLATKVEYFQIPDEPFAGLARIVRITNLSKRPKKIRVLDGLPQVTPYGMNNFFAKEMSRTIEAWMNVENMAKGVPFYRLAVDPADRPEVTHIKEGNFYLGFQHQGKKPEIITPVVDPEYVFGPSTDFSSPSRFIAAKNFSAPKKQFVKSKTPCGFIPLAARLAPRQGMVFYAVIGQMRGIDILNSSLPRITAPGYLEEKKEQNRRNIEALQSDIETKSSCRQLDAYAKQTYLDNIIRGGYPILFRSGSSETVFYIYSRKHGDLERDYNRFHIQPSYFSQGNGNYRDVNQNRRSDVWFNPEIKDSNLISLINLLQLDGFNPLVVKGASFIAKDKDAVKNALEGMSDKKGAARLTSFTSKPFTPGDLLIFIEENNIKLNASRDELLNAVIPCCSKIQEAEHGEGFWIDHWAYNLDLIDAYLNIYPEKKKELFFDKKVFTFYDNIETVKPRSLKFTCHGRHIRQLHSVGVDNEKKELIRSRADHPHLVRTEYGMGQVYETTLINKLLSLFANKLASLDPFGCGIEMEADKPGWNDALNGLPALFGSSVSETFELKRLDKLIIESLTNAKIDMIGLTEETYGLLKDLDGSNKEYFASAEADKDMRYWDRTHCAKESYRENTRLGVSGKEVPVRALELLDMLNTAMKKICLGLERSKDKSKNVYHSYFINQASDCETADGKFTKLPAYTQIKLPLFLESQMHALKLAENASEAEAIIKGTKQSPLYDKKLKMYKINAPLEAMPEEIGRCRIFPPGWLENESIFMHMEYKYLLEILKTGLCREFFAEFKNALVPFQDPGRYGRSILENSSFLVSSAFEDPRLHGNGFVARLSGSTAEFLQMWLTMNIGKAPFFMNGKNELNLRFEPALAGWLFDKNGDYSFNFLSKIKLSYRNPKRKDTFGKSGAAINKMTFCDKNGKPVEIRSNTVPSPYAEQIRSRQIGSIEIHFV